MEYLYLKIQDPSLVLKSFVNVHNITLECTHTGQILSLSNPGHKVNSFETATFEKFVRLTYFRAALY